MLFCCRVNNPCGKEDLKFDCGDIGFYQDVKTRAVHAYCFGDTARCPEKKESSKTGSGLVEQASTNRDITVIPEGPYCYYGVTVDSDHKIKRKNVCPYLEWSDHGVVYCRYLNQGSVMNSQEAFELALAHYGNEQELDKATPLILLWDMVKECGVNDNTEEIEEL